MTACTPLVAPLRSRFSGGFSTNCKGCVLYSDLSIHHPRLSLFCYLASCISVPLSLPHNHVITPLPQPRDFRLIFGLLALPSAHHFIPVLQWLLRPLLLALYISSTLFFGFTSTFSFLPCSCQIFHKHCSIMSLPHSFHVQFIFYIPFLFIVHLIFSLQLFASPEIMLVFCSLLRLIMLPVSY